MAMSIKDVMPDKYGYVVLAVAGGSLVNIYHIIQVAKARKQYGVMAPAVSSEEHPAFNYVMRAHGNYMEVYPFWAATTIFGGLHYPRATAGAAAVFLIGRLIYANDYAKDPKKRGRGFMISSLGSLVSLGATVAFGMDLVGGCGRLQALWKR